MKRHLSSVAALSALAGIAEPPKPKTHLSRKPKRAKPDGNDSEQKISPDDIGTPAEVELRWRYCDAGAALGEHSAWESLVFMAQVGGHIGGGQMDFAPSDSQLRAANQVARIDAALRVLSHLHQSMLEVAFSRRRRDPQVVGLVESVSHGDGERLEPVVSYLLRAGARRIKLDGSGSEVAELVKEARELLGAALKAYEAARAGFVMATAKKLEAKAKPRTKGKGGQLVQFGERGASKRKLVPVEVPRMAEAV
jgi:hypothetical protein